MFAFFLLSIALAHAAGAATVTNLPANAKFDYQIGGAYKPAADVKVVTRDRTAAAVKGLYNICYVNAFQTQPGEAKFWKAKERDGLLLRRKNGKYFEDPDWPGEIFLDTRTDAKRRAIAKIVNGWISECAKKGFKAIEPDNLDTFTRSSGLLTKANNLALAKLLVNHAHSLGLAVGQKNAGSELGKEGKKVAGFDFAVAEECQQYDECGEYTAVYGSRWVEIEYGNKARFDKACKARGKNISVILRDLDVTPKGNKNYKYSQC